MSNKANNSQQSAKQKNQDRQTPGRKKPMDNGIPPKRDQ